MSKSPLIPVRTNLHNDILDMTTDPPTKAPIITPIQRRFYAYKNAVVQMHDMKISSHIFNKQQGDKRRSQQGIDLSKNEHDIDNKHNDSSSSSLHHNDNTTTTTNNDDDTDTLLDKHYTNLATNKGHTISILYSALEYSLMIRKLLYQIGTTREIRLESTIERRTPQPIMIADPPEGSTGYAHLSPEQEHLGSILSTDEILHVLHYSTKQNTSNISKFIKPYLETSHIIISSHNQLIYDILHLIYHQSITLPLSSLSSPLYPIRFPEISHFASFFSNPNIQSYGMPFSLPLSLSASPFFITSQWSPESLQSNLYVDLLALISNTGGNTSSTSSRGYLSAYIPHSINDSSTNSITNTSNPASSTSSSSSSNTRVVSLFKVSPYHSIPPPPRDQMGMNSIYRDIHGGILTNSLHQIIAQSKLRYSYQGGTRLHYIYQQQLQQEQDTANNTTNMTNMAINTPLLEDHSIQDKPTSALQYALYIIRELYKYTIPIPYTLDDIINDDTTIKDNSTSSSSSSSFDNTSFMDQDDEEYEQYSIAPLRPQTYVTRPDSWRSLVIASQLQPLTNITRGLLRRLHMEINHINIPNITIGYNKDLLRIDYSNISTSDPHMNELLLSLSHYLGYIQLFYARHIITLTASSLKYSSIYNKQHNMMRNILLDTVTQQIKQTTLNILSSSSSLSSSSPNHIASVLPHLDITLLGLSYLHIASSILPTSILSSLPLLSQLTVDHHGSGLTILPSLYLKHDQHSALRSHIATLFYAQKNKIRHNSSLYISPLDRLNGHIQLSHWTDVVTLEYLYSKQLHSLSMHGTSSSSSSQVQQPQPPLKPFPLLSCVGLLPHGPSSPYIGITTHSTLHSLPIITSYRAYNKTSILLQQQQYTLSSSSSQQHNSRYLTSPTTQQNIPRVQSSSSYIDSPVSLLPLLVDYSHTLSLRQTLLSKILLLTRTIITPYNSLHRYTTLLWGSLSFKTKTTQKYDVNTGISYSYTCVTLYITWKNRAATLLQQHKPPQSTAPNTTTATVRSYRQLRQNSRSYQPYRQIHQPPQQQQQQQLPSSNSVVPPSTPSSPQPLLSIELYRSSASLYRYDTLSSLIDIYSSQQQQKQQQSLPRSTNNNTTLDCISKHISSSSSAPSMLSSSLTSHRSSVSTMPLIATLSTLADTLSWLTAPVRL